MADDESNTAQIDSNQRDGFLALVKSAASGMDLTRLSMPAWILSDKSFLEIRATLVRNPELFIAAAAEDTPVLRMRAVAAWFLSGWHGRSLPQRKPFNSILGEEFHAVWDRADGGGATAPVYMHCEQVSHHPPVSAFWAEDRAAGVTLQGHVSGKPKFQVHSVKFANTGTSLYTLENLGEEYLIEEPPIYIRGILTFSLKKEVADDAVITCAQTGCRAEFKFQAKPMWRGEYNKVKGTIYDGQGNAAWHFEGKWNDTIEMWPEGKKRDRQVMFSVDEHVLVEPFVRPIDEQNAWESGRVWDTVRRGVQSEDWDMAQTGKNEVEDAQRARRKAREEAGEEWETKFFFWEEATGRWVFNRNLPYSLDLFGSGDDGEGGDGSVGPGGSSHGSSGSHGGRLRDHADSNDDEYEGELLSGDGDGDGRQVVRRVRSADDHGGRGSGGRSGKGRRHRVRKNHSDGSRRRSGSGGVDGSSKGGDQHDAVRRVKRRVRREYHTPTQNIYPDESASGSSSLLSSSSLKWSSDGPPAGRAVGGGVGGGGAGSAGAGAGSGGGRRRSRRHSDGSGGRRSRKSSSGKRRRRRRVRIKRSGRSDPNLNASYDKTPLGPPIPRDARLDFARDEDVEVDSGTIGFFSANEIPLNTSIGNRTASGSDLKGLESSFTT